MYIKNEMENKKAKVGLFIVSDDSQKIQNQYSLDIADTIIKNLQNSNIEIIYDKKIIYKDKEAMNEAIQMKKHDIDALIIYFPAWFSSTTAVSIIMELQEIPLLLWGFFMYEDNEGNKNTTGSIVGELVLKGTLDRMGIEFELIYGLPGEHDNVKKAIDYITAARAKKLLRRSRIGLLGYAGLGMYPGTFDHVLMRKNIGPEIVPIPESCFEDYFTGIDKLEVKKFLAFFIKKVNIDDEIDHPKLIETMRIYLAFKKIIEVFELDGINPRCHYEFSKRLKNTCCLPISLLADESFITGCEGDIPTTISMLVFYLLSNSPAAYGDIMDVDFKNNIIMLSACGFAPFSLLKNKKPDLKLVRYDEVGWEGILSSNVFMEKELVFGRLFEKVGSYGFVYGTGLGIKTSLRGGKFPAINIKINGEAENVLRTASTQHMAFSYSGIEKSLEYFLKIMKIEKIPIK